MERLEEYYKHDVTIGHHEIGRCKDVVITKVNSIIKVARTVYDERFSFRDVVPVGSTPQGLKVYCANEWDYNLKMQLNGRLSWGEVSKLQFNKVEHGPFPSVDKLYDKRYVVIHLGYLGDRKKFGDFLSREEKNTGRMNAAWPTLQSGEMKSWLHQTVNLVLDRKKDDFPDDFPDDSAFDGISLGGPLSPAVTLRGKIDPHNETEIKADLALSIDSALPFEEYTEWPRPATKAWLTADKIDSIKKMGINLVATTHKFWRVSFAECETELIKNIDHHDNGIRKKVYRMLRCMLEGVDEVLKSATASIATSLLSLSSYMLKNVWLWECEKQANPGDWADDKLVQRCVGCVESLKKFVQAKDLPLYFCQDINLFAGKVSLHTDTISRDANHLQKFLNDVLQGVRGENRLISSLNPNAPDFIPRNRQQLDGRINVSVKDDESVDVTLVTDNYENSQLGANADNQFIELERKTKLLWDPTEDLYRDSEKKVTVTEEIGSKIHKNMTAGLAGSDEEEASQFSPWTASSKSTSRNECDPAERSLTALTTLLTSVTEQLTKLSTTQSTLAGLQPPTQDADYFCAMQIYCTLCSTPDCLQKEMNRMELQQRALLMKQRIMFAQQSTHIGTTTCAVTAASTISVPTAAVYSTQHLSWTNSILPPSSTSFHSSGSWAPLGGPRAIPASVASAAASPAWAGWMSSAGSTMPSGSWGLQSNSTQPQSTSPR